MDAASAMGAGDFVALAGSRPACARDERRLPPPAVWPQPLELAKALRARNSGDVLFRPQWLPIGSDGMWEAIRFAWSPHGTDVPPGEVGLAMYVAINNVQGTAPGLYRLCPVCGMLHEVRLGDLTLELQQLYIQPAVNCAAANISIYLAADFDAAGTILGDRGYRVVNMLGGIMAQRVAVMSAAMGLCARPTDAFDPGRLKSFLGLEGSRLTPIFQLVLGRERPGAGAGERYRLAIRF
jgi:SagB-type dehydrogenase family enzyme